MWFMVLVIITGSLPHFGLFVLLHESIKAILARTNVTSETEKFRVAIASYISATAIYMHA